MSANYHGTKTKLWGETYNSFKCHYSPQHNPSISKHICNAHVQRRPAHAWHYVLQYQHRNTTSHSTSQASKPQEQNNPRFPRHAGARVAKGVGAQAGLLDRVDNQHTRCREDEGQPVNEVDMDVGAIEGRMGPDCSVKEDEECEGELRGRSKRRQSR